MATAFKHGSRPHYYSVVDGVLSSISTPGFTPADSIAPLPDRRSPNFVGTARGDAMVEHALLLMRARLRYRLRCLTVTVRPNSWEVVRDITMAHTLQCDHPRFGQVTGKVIRWERAWDGDGGRYGLITVGAALGTGATGIGDLEDVQFATDAGLVSAPVDAYSLSIPGYAVVGVQKAKEVDEQVDIISAEVTAGRDVETALTHSATEVHVQLRPLASVGVIDRHISVSGILLDSPMGYDAGAA